jgi:L-threonylcarbamoyladenylate synthase
MSELIIEIKNAVDALKKGGTILYPTDTIWGIGCDATNPKAIQKVYDLKQRSERKSLIILLHRIEDLSKYVKLVPDQAIELMNQMDRPLTIIYRNAINLPKNLIAEDGSIAIRIVKDDFCTALVSAFGKPIVSTSANISGESNPLMFSQVSEKIKNGVAYTLDYNRDQMNSIKASTIVKFNDNGAFEVVRN